MPYGPGNDVGWSRMPLALDTAGCLYHTLCSCRDTAERHTASIQGGLRILLDFVPSHCSWHHPVFEATRLDTSAPKALVCLYGTMPLSRATSAPQYMYSR